MMVKNIEPLSKLIDDAITDSDLTNKTIAKYLGVHPIEVGRWRNGKHEPSAINLLGLLKLLNVPITDAIPLLSKCTYFPDRPFL